MGSRKKGRSRNSAGGISTNQQPMEKATGLPGNAENKTKSQYRDSLPSLIIALVMSLYNCCIVALISLPFCFLTYSLMLIYGRPPQLVYISQILRYLKLVWIGPIEEEQENYLQPPFSEKTRLSILIFSHSFKSSIYAFGWILDEILYGRQLSNLRPEQQTAVDNPVFVVSAFRSASTQMARSLVSETMFAAKQASPQRPCFVAPNAMMCAYPYLWLWKLMYFIVGDIPENIIPGEEEAVGLTKEDIRQKFNSGFTPDSLARHPNDPFAVDTFDGSFLNYHLNGMIWQMCKFLPTSIIEKEFNYAQQTDPLNKLIWGQDMVCHIDRLARKTLVFHSEDPPAPSQRFLLKGHFLSICPQLQSKYPEGKFLTILRDPCARLQSGVNYMAVNPTLYAHDAKQLIPWKALTKGLQETEAQYCEREMLWFGDGINANDDDPSKTNANPEKLAVTFDAFVANKEKTLGDIIDWTELRDQGDVVFASETSEKKRLSQKKKTPSVASKSSHYRIDRSLLELGVDENAYRERLADYLSWMKKISSSQ